MANDASHPEWRGSSLPDVPRPTGRLWHALAAESIRWEGQVLIVGDESDLPALLVVTRERVALIANGDIALEIPRVWLRPAPQLGAENGIRMFISPDGSDESSPLLLRARLGRGAAAEVVAVLTGRSLPMPLSSPAVSIPSWKEKIGASAPVALPQIEEDAPVAASRQTWPPVEQEGVAVRATRPAQARRGNLPVPGPVPTDVSRAARVQGTERDGFTVADGPNAVSRPVTPASARGRQMVTWTLRAAILLILVGTIGYFGRERLEAGYYDLRDRLPANVQRTLGVAGPDSANEVAFGTAPETVDSDGNDEGDGTDGAKV
ncbi:MAG TPA: hypothetical protein VNZ55_04175, partial [Thermomicrobiales bacterium]|nr:hypothetical protein [Thermomicrobiales bacterium]